MGKHESSITRPYYSVIGKDLLEARKALLDQIVVRMDRNPGAAKALLATGRYSSALDTNIIGIGIGEKVVSGKRSSVMSIKVLVAKKYPRGHITRQNRIPSTIDGLPTDVEAMGYPKKLYTANQMRQRPVMAGISISPTRRLTNPRALAGTLGFFALDKVNRRLHLISNNHVIALENALPIGEAIVQPGSLDGGTESDVIGRLTHIVPLKFDNKRNWMDAAAALLNDRLETDRSIRDIGLPSGTSQARLNSLVRKSGRSSGLTEGVVRVVNLDLMNRLYSK